MRGSDVGAGGTVRKAGGHAQGVGMDRREVSAGRSDRATRRGRAAVHPAVGRGGQPALAGLQRPVEQRRPGDADRPRPLLRRLRATIPTRCPAGSRVPSRSRHGGRPRHLRVGGVARRRLDRVVQPRLVGHRNPHRLDGPVRPRRGRPGLGVLRHPAPGPFGDGRAGRRERGRLLGPPRGLSGTGAGAVGCAGRRPRRRRRCAARRVALRAGHRLPAAGPARGGAGPGALRLANAAGRRLAAGAAERVGPVARAGGCARAHAARRGRSALQPSR